VKPRGSGAGLRGGGEPRKKGGTGTEKVRKKKKPGVTGPALVGDRKTKKWRGGGKQV